MDADVRRRCRETRADLGMQGQGREERRVLPSFPGQLGGCWHLSLKQEIEEKEQAWASSGKGLRALAVQTAGVQRATLLRTYYILGSVGRLPGPILYPQQLRPVEV